MSRDVNYAALHETICTRARQDYVAAAKKIVRAIDNGMMPSPCHVSEMADIEKFFRRGALGVLDEDGAEGAIRALRYTMRETLRSKKYVKQNYSNRAVDEKPGREAHKQRCGGDNL